MTTLATRHTSTLRHRIVFAIVAAGPEGRTLTQLAADAGTDRERALQAIHNARRAGDDLVRVVPTDGEAVYVARRHEPVGPPRDLRSAVRSAIRDAGADGISAPDMALAFQVSRHAIAAAISGVVDVQALRASGHGGRVRYVMRERPTPVETGDHLPMLRAGRGVQRDCARWAECLTRYLATERGGSGRVEARTVRCQHDCEDFVKPDRDEELARATMKRRTQEA